MTIIQKTLPKGWKWARLGDVGEIVTGNTPSKKQDTFYNERHINFFKPDDFDQNMVTALTESKDFISEEGSKYARIAPSGTVLVTCIGTIGKVGIIEKESSFNQQINAIVPNSTRIISKYLAYAVSKRKDLLERFTNAPVVPIINKSQFSQFEIPLPPLPTQHKIVEILEEADNLRKLRKRADEKMKDLIPSLFVQMFCDPSTNSKKWEIRRLEEVCIKITDGSHVTPTYIDEGIPFLRVTDIQGSEIDWDNVKRIPEHEYLEITKRTKPEIGDVLYSKNGTIGIAKMITWDTKFCHFVSLALLKPNHGKLQSKFFETFLNTPIALKQAIDRSKQGTVTNLHLNEIKRIKIPLPPLPLQQEFARLVEDIEAEKARQAESKKKLDELFQSLMQRAFTGELVA